LWWIVVFVYYAGVLGLLCIGTCQSLWLDFTRSQDEPAGTASPHTADFTTHDVTAIPLLFLSRKIRRGKCVWLSTFSRLLS